MSVDKPRDAKVVEILYSDATGEPGESPRVYKTKYYAKNAEKIRANAREYSKRIRLDPVRKELINAKKREFMRQLKIRRRAEQQELKAQNQIRELESSQSASEINASGDYHLLDLQETYVDVKDEVTEYVFEEEEAETLIEGEEEQEIVIGPERTISTSSEQIEEVVDQQPGDPLNASTNHFPFASTIADCLEGEEQRKYISYIEDIAQLYFKHFGIGRLEKTKLPLLLKR